MKLLKSNSLFLFLITSSLFLLGCVSDPGVAKKRGLVKDFSIVRTTVGCGDKFLILPEADSCTTACDTKTHLANATEIATAKTEAANDESLLAKINGSPKGLCVPDVVKISRPTNQIDIKSDFCSCIDGKSDIISDCAATCSTKPSTTVPMLYLNTTVGPEIALNTKLGNLENWCKVQLEDDTAAPACFLSAYDGSTTLKIPIGPQDIINNSLSVDIKALALDRTYIVKILEANTGTNAQSKEFQLRRKTQPPDDQGQIGALKVTPINQYTCMTYGGKIENTTGQIIRDSYARVFYYFAANETPPPIPPAGGTNQSQVVCHDEQLHPGNDNAEYPRLEMIPQALAMWDKSDPRFINSDGTTISINKIIKSRLLIEHGIVATTIDLFKLINYPNRPTTATTSPGTGIPLGYMMVPFVDKSGKAFCPTQTDYNGTDPLFNLLKEYMGDTEGLFLAEKEAETIQDGTAYKTVYGTMFITETILKTYGFYIENGLKIKANQSSMNTKTIYYYWPIDKTVGADPLTQGNRKLFTVRLPSMLNGNVPTGQSTTSNSSDKRIGCIPKSSSL